MRSAKKISIGKSVGIHLGYLCIHKENVKMYFNKRGCTMSLNDSTIHSFDTRQGISSQDEHLLLKEDLVA